MKFRPGYLALAPLAPLGAAVAHAVLMPKKKSAYQPQPDADRAMAYAEKLAAMIRCDTTSYANVYAPERFERFHAQLAQLFPLVHEKLERTVIDGNLLFCWKGKAHDRPIVLMSHQDVVPAEGTWSHAPFSGDIADGKVWGRGASDTKASLMAFFQAVEELLAAGYEPANDVYLSSSCTEEWAGDGAPKIVAELKRYYNVDIRFMDNRLRDMRFSGNFRVEDGIYHIMSVLQLTYKFNYRIAGNDIELYANPER